MQKNEKFFIFSWKEIVVLTLLGMTLIGFFFTLGLHYGKKIRPETQAVETPAQKLEESPESVPAKETLAQGAQHVEAAAEEAIKSATEQAIKENGVQVENPRPVDLPKEKVTPPVEEKAAATEEKATEDSGPHFAVQLGSYPNKKDAHGKIQVLLHRGLHAEVRTAMVNGETRYRVVLPGFKSKKLADAHGRDLRLHRKIENFVVIKSE